MTALSNAESAARTRWTNLSGICGLRSNDGDARLSLVPQYDGGADSAGRRAATKATSVVIVDGLAGLFGPAHLDTRECLRVATARPTRTYSAGASQSSAWKTTLTPWLR